MKLTKQQKGAIQKVKDYKIGALLMSPGTGKTYTAHLLSINTDADYILRLTPCQNIDNIITELQAYGRDDRIEVGGIESISMSDRIYLEVFEKVKSHKKVFIILDESIKIKNYEAKRTQRLLNISNYCEYKLILNGTPITKNILDLRCQFEFLSNKILNMNKDDFKYKFCDFQRITERKRHGKIVRERMLGYRNLDHLKKLIEPYIYECTLELSVCKCFKKVEYEVPHAYESIYTDIKEKYLSEYLLDSMNNNIFLAMVQELQMSYALNEQKLVELKRIISGYYSKKVMIFCKFVKCEELLKEMYPEVLVLTYGKHSFGLNLQHKNITIYFDKTFDYSHRLQSEFRTYRTGQQYDCIYYDLTSDVPLDALIDRNISKKTSVSEALKKEGIKSFYHKLSKWGKQSTMPV